MLPLVYSPDYVTAMPQGHRFPMSKFALLHQRLLQNGIATLEQFHCPQIAPRDWLCLVHNPGYVQDFCEGTLDSKALRRIGLPWNSGLAHRTCTAVGGTVLTARLALASGLACNTAGGTHHAFPDFGSGFCIFNDMAIATRVLQQEGLIKKALIIDLDVHQGDGTAFIFRDDPSVFTFSMHCEENFPGHKQKSDLDVPLPQGMGDDAYIQVLKSHLLGLIKDVKPDLIFYDAGVDPHHADRLGKLKLTDEGLYRRDMEVLSTALALGYPVAAVIGGGYDDNLHALVARHAILHQAATEIYQRFSP